ncbi:MAG: HupE/UreJ family protein [Betaproteobacteria bacterium]|jgi:urease accessory protein
MHERDGGNSAARPEGLVFSRHAWAWLGIGLFPTAALAHHVMGGVLPSTFSQGLLSGLGHPVIGLDHFLFVLALGVLCWRMEIGARAIAAFLGASLLGIALHLALVGVPGNESLVALSLLAIGIALGSGRRWSRSGMTIAAAVAGIFHGYAYGESIVGAEAGVLLAYLLGLVAVQSLIGAAAYWAAKTIAYRFASGQRVARWIGALVSVVGAGFLLLSFG